MEAPPPHLLLGIGHRLAGRRHRALRPLQLLPALHCKAPRLLQLGCQLHREQHRMKSTHQLALALRITAAISCRPRFLASNNKHHKQLPLASRARA